MKKFFLRSTLFIAATLSVFSCSKTSNTINNSQVIETPYSLYFTDSSGVLYNTNDGKNAKVIFASDGLPSRALITMGTNLMWIKGHDIALPGPTMFFSYNSGINFNHGFDSITSLPMVTVNGKIANLNQSMVMYVPAWQSAYCVTNNADGQNIFGIAGNPLNGLPGYWVRENYYDTDQIVYPHDINTTSLALLKKSTLIAFDGIHNPNRIFFRAQLMDRWKEVMPGTSALPASSSTIMFSVGHINNRLVAIDNLGGSAGAGGSAAYYSDDNGANWFPYSGLPANTPMQCVGAPFEQVCLVGTDGKGVYLLNPNTNVFEARNNGLPANASVRGISFKENIYKNGTKAQFVYITTNQGLYQSTDMGNNWVRTIAGNFCTIY
jgi:hypothetical protein